MILVTLIIFYFLCYVNAFPEEEQMEHEVDFSGYNRIMPWHCCALCPDELRHWRNGRCLNQSSLTLPYPELDAFADKTALIFMTSNAGCCYFCGEKSNDYILQCEDKSLGVRCCPTSKKYCQKAPSVKANVQSPRITSTLKCYGCMAVLNLLNEIRYQAIDIIIDEISSFCDFLFGFKRECLSMMDPEMLKSLVIFFIH